MSDSRHDPDFRRDIIAQVVERSRRGERLVSVLVLQAEGSSPCRPGARALLAADGRLLGTVGGGQLEAEAHRRARMALRSGRPGLFDFDLMGAGFDGRQPICGGRVRVLVDPTPAGSVESYAAAVAARDLRASGALLTRVVHEPEVRVSVEFVADASAPSLAEALDVGRVRQALLDEKPVLIDFPPAGSASKMELFIEPVVPLPELVIVGGGHVGQALATQAALVGFDIRVIDDRPEFTRPELFPSGTTTCCGNMVEELGRVRMDARTYVVIVTRGHQHDAEALEHCLGRSAGYVGMIGSRRKVSLMRQSFLDTGRADLAAWNRIHTPVGIEIGSVTPAEIAVSIVAELIAVRRGVPLAKPVSPPA